MNTNNLIIVRVSLEHKTFDMDAVDSQIYGVNNCDKDLKIYFKNESFTTVDEESGHSIKHGTSDYDFILMPHEVKLIAEVKGWEWDGHVGMTIVYKIKGNEICFENSYDFKSTMADYFIKKLNLHGRVIGSLLKSGSRK